MSAGPFRVVKDTVALRRSEILADNIVRLDDRITNLPRFTEEGDLDVSANRIIFSGTNNAVVIGSGTRLPPNQFSVAIGFSAAPGAQSVAIGPLAGSTDNDANCVAVGRRAGRLTQSSEATAIGSQAGELNQGVRATAIGSFAGYSNQGSNAVAIGHRAAPNGQGDFAIALGTLAGRGSVQAANSIILSALGDDLQNPEPSSCRIAPVRNVAGEGLLQYNATTKEISYRNDLPFNVAVTGDLSVTGSVSKGSGSFRIPHPLKGDTHALVHSFIEGPRADLIYRGRVRLTGGQAQVDVDAAAGMSPGTFVSLARDPQCFVSNETSWAPARAHCVEGIMHITCQDPESSDTVSWLLVAERQDAVIRAAGWTDEEGRVIVEPAL